LRCTVHRDAVLLGPVGQDQLAAMRAALATHGCALKRRRPFLFRMHKRGIPVPYVDLPVVSVLSAGVDLVGVGCTLVAWLGRGWSRW
jgi:hypothetical protein